jgi:RimJ/RimL family protein N-acetyltransferase
MMANPKGIPEEWTKRVRLKDGTSVLLRPEVPTDLEMLWKMYSTLSDKSLKFLPNPFTRERVESWIENLNYDRVLPILAVVEENSKEKIVAGATLAFSQVEVFKHKAEFGITVHDDYQDRGLGTALTKHMIEIARSKGLKKISLTVVTENSRAIRVYEKCGFRIEGRLEKDHYNYITGEYGDDYIMALFLS